VNSAALLFAVALSYIGIMVIAHTAAKQAVTKARKAGFLDGYRKCLSSCRSIVKPPTNTNTN
jgi:hypothetical protein